MRLGLGLGVLALAACAVEGEKAGGLEPLGEVELRHCSDDLAENFGVTFRPSAAMPNNEVGKHDRSDEHCWVGAGREALVGRQLRIVAGTGEEKRVALCTVSDTHTLGNGIITLNTEAALAKLNITADRAGAAGDRAFPCGWVAQTLGTYDDTPTDQSSIGERVHDPAGTGRVAFTAPHGGGIESGTDQQVKFLDEGTGLSFNAWFWAVKGVGSGQRGRLHITSTELSARSFDGLAHIADHQNDIRQVVSFHGHGSTGTCTEDALVGGGAPADYRAAIGDAIALYRGALGVAAGDLTIRTDFAACDDNAGDDQTNYVNRYSDLFEGVQIEQSKRLRDDLTRRELVAEAVANYVTAFNNDTVLNLGQVASNAASSRPGISLGAAFQVPANRAVASPTDYGACSSADVARADWWQRTAANGLQRLGGGALACVNGRWRPGTGFGAWTLPAAAATQVRVVANAYKLGGATPTLAVTVN